MWDQNDGFLPVKLWKCLQEWENNFSFSSFDTICEKIYVKTYLESNLKWVYSESTQAYSTGLPRRVFIELHS